MFLLACCIKSIAVCFLLCLYCCICIISSGWSCHKYHFCCDKSSVVTNMCLVQQKSLSGQTIFVVTNKSFVTTSILLLQQAYFCCDKRHVLSQQTHICHDKIKHVVTKVLSQLNYICCNKSCHNKNMFVAKKVLSRRKTCFVVTSICLSQQNIYVVKMILVAAPTKDSVGALFKKTTTVGSLKKKRE